MFQEIDMYFLSKACGGEVVSLMWTWGGGSKTRFSRGRHKWMTPNSVFSKTCVQREA